MVINNYLAANDLPKSYPATSRALLLSRNYLHSAYDADPTISRRIIMGVNFGVFTWEADGPAVSVNAIPTASVVVTGRIIYQNRQRVVAPEEIALRVLGELSGFRTVEAQNASRDEFLRAVRAYIIGYRYSQTNAQVYNYSELDEIEQGVYDTIYETDPAQVEALRNVLDVADNLPPDDYDEMNAARQNANLENRREATLNDNALCIRLPTTFEEAYDYAINEGIRVLYQINIGNGYVGKCRFNCD